MPIKQLRQRIKILATDNIAFQDLLKAADFFISPILDKDSTVAPPYTWIECMSRGVPIITTDVSGADELIANRVTGYISETEYYFKKTIIDAIRLKDYLPEMSKKAKEVVARKFNLKNIAEDYLELWKRSSASMKAKNFLRKEADANL